VGGATHTRRKDRLSYSHEEFKIDLTQVTSSTSPNAPVNKFKKVLFRFSFSSYPLLSEQPQILHELELEIARPELLLTTAIKRNDPAASEFERGAFDELIRAFVNNARILVRNANEGWQ
jgi:polynucleotide 5'-triphosphatase